MYTKLSETARGYCMYVFLVILLVHTKYTDMAVSKCQQKFSRVKVS